LTPAERVAGSFCLLARHRGSATATHPVRCRFCDIDLPQLEADVHSGDGTDFASFMQLPERRRREMVQGAAAIPIASWMDGL